MSEVAAKKSSVRFDTTGLTGQATTAAAPPPVGVTAVPSPEADLRGFDYYAQEALNVASTSGPYQHLFSVLAGNTVVVSHDNIHDELRDRCTRIMSGLTRYKNVKHPKFKAQTDAKEQIKVNMMERLELDEDTTIELICSYLAFEYNGLEGLKNHLSTPQEQAKFLNIMETFYKRERICHIYCSQIILSGSMDPNHVYYNVFGGFVTSTELDSWTKRLCLSLDIANCDEERVELLHALAILIHYFGTNEDVLSALKRSYTRVREEYLTRNVKLAEAVLFSATMQCGDTEEAPLIQEFITKHLDMLKNNEFVIIPLASYFSSRFSGSKFIKTQLQKALEGRRSIVDLMKLVQDYSFGSIKYRHGVGPVALKCSFVALEAILGTMYSETRSTSKQELLDLLRCLLENTEIAQLALSEPPSPVIDLYRQALALFPVQIDNLLSIWASLVRTSNGDLTSLEVLDTMTELNSIAEYLDGIDQQHYDVTEEGIVLFVERKIANITIAAGSKGQIVYHTRFPKYPVVSWAFEEPVTSATVWTVLSRTLLRPALAMSSIPERTVKIICNLAEFLIKFGEFSTEISGAILQLFPPVSHILRKMEVAESDMSTKCLYISLLLGVVSCASKFEMHFLREQATGLWPIPSEQNLVSDLILGHESLTNSGFKVTRAFIKSLNDLLPGTTNKDSSLSEPERPSPLGWRNELYVFGVKFVLKSIFPSYARWRFAHLKDQNEILQGCFHVFHGLFNLSSKWDYLKEHVCTEIIHPSTPLLILLKNVDEESLRECRIRTTETNSFLEKTMHLGLSLVLRITNFEPKTIRYLDAASGSTLIQCMGKLFRHRVIVTVPTLAIKMLTKIAYDLDMSILACIGSQVEAFRDLVMLRLTYRTEDSGLRVAILDFLSVCFQTQSGLVTHFLKEESFAERIIALLEEEDTNIPTATLSVIRAIIGKGNGVLKAKVENVWKKIAGPINNIDKFNETEQREVITCTMHILSFELYREGVLDQELCTEVREILEPNLIQLIFNVAIGEMNEDNKCLLSLKHILTLVLGRPELSDMLEVETSRMLSDIVTEEYWKSRASVSEVRTTFRVPLVELMLILAGGQGLEYLKILSETLEDVIFQESLGVQIPLLACMAKVVHNLRGKQIPRSVVESLVKITSRIFKSATRVYEFEDNKKPQPLLTLATAITYNITLSKKVDTWLEVYQNHSLILSLVKVASIGLTREMAPDVVMECLATLIRLSLRSETGYLVRNCNLGKNLFSPSLQYGTPETEGRWNDVYLMCVQLNTALLITEKHYYIDECLSFWGSHGGYLSFKLFDLVDMVNNCFLNNPEKNFAQVLSNLIFNNFTFTSISAMLPYLLPWQLQQPECLGKVMEGIFVTLKAAVGLLTQPNHLQLVITKKPKSRSSPMHARRTPELMDVQNTLWDIMLMGVHIYLAMMESHVCFVECKQLLALLYSIISLPIKVLSKHGDKRPILAINDIPKATLTLEKALSLLVYRVRSYLEAPRIDAKQKQNFRRECISEISSICDGVKRLGLPVNSFSSTSCAVLEILLKDPPN